MIKVTGGWCGTYPIHGPSIGPIVTIPIYLPRSAGAAISPAVPAPNTSHFDKGMSLLLTETEDIHMIIILAPSARTGPLPAADMHRRSKRAE